MIKDHYTFNMAKNNHLKYSFINDQIIDKLLDNPYNYNHYRFCE